MWSASVDGSVCVWERARVVCLQHFSVGVAQARGGATVFVAAVQQCAMDRLWVASDAGAVRVYAAAAAESTARPLEAAPDDGARAAAEQAELQHRLSEVTERLRVAQRKERTVDERCNTLEVPPPPPRGPPPLRSLPPSPPRGTPPPLRWHTAPPQSTGPRRSEALPPKAQCPGQAFA